MYHQVPLDPSEVQYPEDPVSGSDDHSFVPIEDLEDGSTIYQFQDPNQQLPAEPIQHDFYENIAERLEDSDLAGISGKLLDHIRQDRESRKDWEQKIERVLEYLGLTIEEARDIPFMKACAAYDSTMSTALMRFWAMARAELFPASGPAKSEILGEITDQKELAGNVIGKFLNYYLTQLDKPYYKDSDQLLLYVGFYGCAFRKVYQDNLLGRPLARFVKPYDLIINNNTVSLLESSRITQQFSMTRKDILLLQESGVYKDVKIPEIVDEHEDHGTLEKVTEKNEGVDTDSYENKTLFTFYESHVDIVIEGIDEDLNRGKIPLPYIITLCETNKKIVSIKRNWKEGDKSFNKKDYFVHYQYLPGFGIYSLGIAHLAGSNSMILTAIERLVIDAETMKTFPGGLKVAGLRTKNNDKAVGPASFVEVETGSLPIRDAVMPLPYPGASPLIWEVWKEIGTQTEKLISTAEMQTAEGRTDAPVGTTLALLEVNSRLISSILRSLHASLGEELKMLFNLFAENMKNQAFPFSVPGEEVVLLKEYFNENVQVVPVSDPNLITSTHRILRNEALLKLAQSAPEIHNIKEAYHRMYTAMGVQDINKLLPPEPDPVSLDPVTENMMVSLGKPIKVSMSQNDEAHVVVHQSYLQDPALQANPPALAQIRMHIQQHEAYKLLKQFQQQLQQQGQQMPQIQEEQILMIPEIQNALAAQDAQKVIEQQQQMMQQQQEAASKQIDPNQVMLADIDQRREASHLKDEEAKLKAETESFKAQLKFESEKAKIKANQDMAVDKHQVDLTIAEMKQPNVNEEYLNA